MKTIVEFLSDLNKIDVKVWVEGNRLHYNAPKGVLSSALRAELSERKPEILALLQETTPLPTVKPDPERRYDPFPLTTIQRAYWLGRSEAFELGQISAHIYVEIECPDLDPERLNGAWQKIVDRHEMLRAVVSPDGQQRILEKVPAYEIEFSDLRGKAEPVVTSHLEAVRGALSHLCTPSDQWPLFVIRATQYGDSVVLLHISLDGLNLDMFSVLLIAREWYAFYQNPDYSPVPIELSFRDYVLTEKTLQNTALYRRSREYWFSRLDTLPPAPELPLACNPVTLKQSRFTRRQYAVPGKRWQPLKRRVTQEGLTPSGFLLATFAEVLNAWSKNSHFTINLSLFNRLPLHNQVNDIVGDFTTLTLFEADHSTPATFRDRALGVQKRLWQDLDHRYVSGVTVQGELSRRRGGERAVFPVVFTSGLALEVPEDEMDALNSFGKIIYGISQTPQVWLDYLVVENKGALVFAWDAVEALFPEGLLDDMFEAYCRFLNDLADSESAMDRSFRQWLPSRQLSRQKAVNATASPVSEELLNTLFTAQVENRENAPAVISPQRSLTYRELFERANDIGTHLRQRGVTPNTLVAVVMEKGWEEVVATLGILMSGAAYLPIDPNLPEDRRHYLLDQGDVKIALTQPKLAESLSWPEGVRQIRVEAEYTMRRPLKPIQSPEDLAYVIYTSGSTGLPKGVMIDHRGAVNTILDINNRYRVGPQDRVFALSALNFDLSVYDIFGLLAAGGTVVFPHANASKDPAHWAEMIRAHQVTIWDTVPTLMQMFVEHLTATPVPASSSLRLALLSGDWIPLELPAQIKAVFNEIEVIGQGGATEASIWSIFHPIDRVEPCWKSIPYGKPLNNQSFHVLNTHMEPCPTWVPGELFIGGIGLGKGYWRDREKTRRQFIIHPRTKERLYKTGDLGRYLPDGNIEFLGREDLQVKIGGFRIELGEIETVLKEHSWVKDAVVKAVGERFGGKQLVAYVIAEQDPDSFHGREEIYERNEGGNGSDRVLTDPLDRLQFRLKQPGIRPIDPTQDAFSLLKPQFDDAQREAYLRRQSYRQYVDQAIPLEHFSYFLSCLRQVRLDPAPLPKYRYPSAGSLYPVQTYLFIKPGRLSGLAGGFYYYHPVDHHLVLIDAATEMDARIYDEFNRPFFNQSAFSLFLVGRLEAIAPLYGKFARDFSMLEAGYMSQLLMSVSPDYEIGLCPIGNMKFERVRNLFGLEPGQILLHSFVGGKIEPAQPRQWLQQQPITEKDRLSEQLRDHLRQKLPDYMVPSCFVLLEGFPLTPNGKVDRNALKEPDDFRLPETVPYEQPRTGMEKTIEGIVRDILGKEKVGRNRNFFELGADSIQIIRMNNKLKGALDCDITVVEMFQKPTIRLLAEHLIRDQVSTPHAEQNMNRADKAREFFKRQRDFQS